MTTTTIIPEILTEVLTTLAQHYGTTVEDTRQAYLLNVGNVRQEVRDLYSQVVSQLTATAA